MRCGSPRAWFEVVVLRGSLVRSWLPGLPGCAYNWLVMFVICGLV